MKKFFIVWGMISLGYLLIFLLTAKFDLFLHPWISTTAVSWKWYTYFLSSHSPTAMYLFHFYCWFFIIILLSALSALYYIRKWPR